MTTVEERLREAGASLEPPELELPAFRSLRRRVRRRRLAAVTGFVALVACASVAVTAANSRDRVEVAHVASTSTSTASVRPSETTTSAAASSVLDPANRAVITSRLDAYVAGQLAEESTAGKSAPGNVWGEPVLSEVSPPEEVDGSVLAVVAFSFDPKGRPVQILGYENQKWAPVALLAAPTSPGTIEHPGALDLISEGAPIAVANVTGKTRPDFFIEFAGGGCVNEAMVSTAGTRDRWRYVPFRGPFPTGDLLGGNPAVIGGVLTSTNDCAATVLPSERRSWTWTYDGSSGAMIGDVHAGWPARPSGVGGNAG